MGGGSVSRFFMLEIIIEEQTYDCPIVPTLMFDLLQELLMFYR